MRRVTRHRTGNLFDHATESARPPHHEAGFSRVEHDHGFEFTDAHRAFLATGLPVDVPAST